MRLALTAADPWPEPVREPQARRTLDTLRREPTRGRYQRLGFSGSNTVLHRRRSPAGGQ